MSELFEELSRYVAILREERVSGSHRVDYRGYRKNHDHRMFLELLRRLEEADPVTLGVGPGAKAFWINMYNAGVIYSLVQHGQPQTLLQRRQFFGRELLGIGSLVFSLDDIEHGLLRGNRRPPAGLTRPFGRRDPRLDLVFELDPRIHFALNCGSVSCPVIRHYTSAELDAQLDTATRSFVAQEARRAGGTVELSELFKWYAADFGDVRAFVAHYTDDPELAEMLRSEASPLVYKRYDWSLNGAW
jgi:hypothetical protein